MVVVRGRRTLVAALAIVFASFAPLAAVDEATVRAAYLLNFAKYVQWPEDAFATSPGGALVLCVVRDREVHAMLAARAKDTQLDDQPVAVRAVTEPGEAEGCHLLYVPDAGDPRFPAIRRVLRDEPVLFVGDGDEFLRRGGMIAFVREGRRLRFEIDNGAAADSGLKLSSQLLKIARRVLDDDAPGADR